jgi:N utilization substance protein B
MDANKKKRFMYARRLARELALQFLFQLDIQKPDNLQEALEEFWEQVGLYFFFADGKRRFDVYDDVLKSFLNSTIKFELDKEIIDDFPTLSEMKGVKEYVENIVRGVLDNQDDIDKVITSCADNWRLDRMSTVDRNLIRLATYEIKYLDDIPVPVSIDEAIEISKDYSDVKSSNFINGILDKIKGI